MLPHTPAPAILSPLLMLLLPPLLMLLLPPHMLESSARNQEKQEAELRYRLETMIKASIERDPDVRATMEKAPALLFGRR